MVRRIFDCLRQIPVAYDIRLIRCWLFRFSRRSVLRCWRLNWLAPFVILNRHTSASLRYLAEALVVLAGAFVAGFASVFGSSTFTASTSPSNTAISSLSFVSYTPLENRFNPLLT